MGFSLVLKNFFEACVSKRLYRFAITLNNDFIQQISFVLGHYIDHAKDIYLAVKIWDIMLHGAGGYTLSLSSLPFGFFMSIVCSVTISEAAVILVVVLHPQFQCWLVVQL